MEKKRKNGQKIIISDIIDIARLERESRKYLYIGFAVAILFHGLIGMFLTFRTFEVTTVQERRSMTVELIERPPSLSEPFEIHRRSFTRKSLQKLTQDSKRLPGSVTSRLKTPGTTGETVDTGDILYEPEARVQGGDERFIPEGFFLEDDGIERVPDGHIPFTDEWISIGDLDTGRYKALIIHDPNDRTNVKGYVHIPVAVRGTNLGPAVLGAISNLNEGFFRYTGITLKVDRGINFSSPDLIKYPFVYVSAAGMVDITRYEALCFKEYLDRGGFALFEPYGVSMALKATSLTAWLNNKKEDAIKKEIAIPSGAPPLKEVVRKILGDDIGFKVIAKDHDVFHSAFDAEVEDIDGAFAEGRLILIYSLKGFGKGWVDREPFSMKVGINMVLYALETGGIAQQLIDDSTSPVQNSRQWWDYNERKKKDKWVQ